MANIVIKKNFVDGDKLFAQQLNNNFETIEKGINDGNKIVWQDGTEVKFKRYVTDDIDSLPILDGSIIYDTEKGRHYIDYKGQRVQVGSAGKEVLVQKEQPTEEDNKIWIESDIVNTMGTEVVNSLEGNETNMAPSVNLINKLNTYSTEEQRIGIYLDKPLYRKTFNVGTVSQNMLVIGNIPNLDMVIKGVAPAKRDTVLLFLSDVWGNANGDIAISDDRLTEMTNISVTVEYTKTTDSEVI